MMTPVFLGNDVHVRAGVGCTRDGGHSLRMRGRAPLNQSLGHSPPSHGGGGVALTFTYFLFWCCIVIQAAEASFSIQRMPCPILTLCNGVKPHMGFRELLKKSHQIGHAAVSWLLSELIRFWSHSKMFCLPFGTTGAAFYSLHESYPTPVSTLWTIFIRYHFGIWNHSYSHISLILLLITKRPLIIPSTTMPVSIANTMLLLLSSISTETEMSLFWPNFRHWYIRILVKPVKISLITTIPFQCSAKCWLHRITQL